MATDVGDHSRSCRGGMKIERVGLSRGFSGEPRSSHRVSWTPFTPSWASKASVTTSMLWPWTTRRTALRRCPCGPCWRCGAPRGFFDVAVKNTPWKIERLEPTAITHEKKGKWSEPNLHDYGPCWSSRVYSKDTFWYWKHILFFSRWRVWLGSGCHIPWRIEDGID